MYKTFKYTQIKQYPFLVLLLGTYMFWSCDKNIDVPEPRLINPTAQDLDAGKWKTYVLNTATEIDIPQPIGQGSDLYIADLSNLKLATANVTKKQIEAINYWAAGAVYRWNEIARELAAQHNIPPAYDPVQGKYPVADVANPNAEPKFPFANPPYTARALAYLSVAQYDALVAAMAFKAKYPREAPSKLDASIKTLLPQTGISSYPSEDAVVAQASFQVLIAMFPGDVPYLEAKLAEHKNSRLWAGMNFQSDVNTGADLGKAVAVKVLARAKNDGMSAANNQAITVGLIAEAKLRGLSQEWISQEAPKRPPMLPNFGAVSTWNIMKTDLVTIRPSAPPAIGSNEYNKDMNELRAIARKQTRDQARIANYWADGVGSHTPPGHWHRRAAELCNANNYSEVRTARTLALLGTAVMDAGISCWEAKYYYYYPRPFQIDNSIKTNVGLPNFPSYTSGHSTFSAAAATVLSYVFPAEATKLKDEAVEASNSRIYGLIHYRVDCEKGLEAGNKVGQFAVDRGKTDKSGL